MKIIHIILSKGFSGSEKYVVDLINIQSLKHECFLIINKKNNYYEKYCQINKKIKIIKISNFLSFLLINLSLNIIRPQIVHTHLGDASKKVIKRKFFKLISTLHMNFKKKYYKNHDGLIVSNETKKIEINNKLKCAVKKIYLWPCSNNIENTVSISDLKKRYEIEKNDFIFGSIGRFHYQKGFDILQKVFKEISNKKIYLFLIGNDHDKFNHYKSKNIITLPFQKNTAQFYKLFDCFIMSSRWETFGMTLIEAMQNKLPIITTVHEGNQDWIKNYNVDIFNINNHSELKNLVDKRFKLGKQKINYDLTIFNKIDRCREIQDFYNEI